MINQTMANSHGFCKLLMMQNKMVFIVSPDGTNWDKVGHKNNFIVGHKWPDIMRDNLKDMH